LADVTKPADVERFVSEAISEFGGVDLLVANAGVSSGAGLLDATREDWGTTFELNSFHAACATRAVVPSMRERGGGRVVFVASISGRKPVHRRWQYGAAKAAVIHAARCLALELAPVKIRVNSVSPGSIMISGGQWEKYRVDDPEHFDRFIREEMPLGRLGQPGEVADAVAFLLSERGSWINGADLGFCAAVAAIIPARPAASINPVDALRTE
jgi:3-oxoacyl-[acyl-carrier protein] reductase